MDERVKRICAAEYEYCRGDLLYWVNNYCPIEDKDAPEVVVPFTAWPAQEELLRGYLHNRLNIVLKARQLGVTWLSLYYCVHDLISHAGHTVIALSKTETEALELVRRAKVILDYQPEILAGGEIEYDGTTSTVNIRHKNGLISKFQSFASSESTARSFTANILFLDEWAFQQWAREIWTSAYPTINRPTGGKVIGLSTIKRGTLFEELYCDEGNNFKKYFLSVYDDPRRTVEWYEQTSRDLGQLVKQEYPRTAAEALSNIGGAFYPEFDERIHVIKPFPVPAYWRRYMAMDYGLDMLAAGFYAVDSHNNHYKIAEIHKSGLVVSAAAAEIDKTIQQLGWEDGRITKLAPPDLWNKASQTGKSAADIFSQHGHNLVRVSNNFANGCLAVKELLRVRVGEDERPTAQLKVFECCPVTIRYVAEILTDEKNPNVYAKEPHEYSHINDECRYYSVYWTGTAKEPEQEKPKTAKELLKQMGFKRI